MGIGVCHPISAVVGKGITPHPLPGMKKYPERWLRGTPDEGLGEDRLIGHG
jgi:hypothetical protein